jgi:ABC-type multidrug transport system ATPase subunit
MSILQASSLTRHYGGRRGIEAVDLSVREGSLFGFLGPNGAGKTTTIRVLLGLLSPSAGEAKIFGLDCWRQSEAIKGEVGYVKSINTFLQQFYIYAVDFPDRGYAVGMKGREIESIDNPPPPKAAAGTEQRT